MYAVARARPRPARLHGGHPQHELLRARSRPPESHGRQAAGIYADDYADGLDAIDKNALVPVPPGPGLGVAYD